MSNGVSVIPRPGPCGDPAKTLGLDSTPKNRCSQNGNNKPLGRLTNPINASIFSEVKRYLYRLVMVVALMLCAKSAMAGAIKFELTPLPPGRAEAWLERMYTAVDEYYGNIWAIHNAPWIQPWKKIAREKVHSQPTFEKVIQAANREIYKRFDYTPDYYPGRKKKDRWSVVLGFTDQEVKFRGDCEDYALVVWLALARHVNPNKVFVMVGASDDGTHAVLLVKHDNTDYVVDSRFLRVFKNELPRDFKPRLAVGRQHAFAVRIHRLE